MPIGETATNAVLLRTNYVARGHELGQMVRRAPPVMRGPLRLSTAFYGFPRGFLTIQ
jgi:hypothetical protein